MLPQPPPELVDLLRAGQVVAVVGSGFSLLEDAALVRPPVYSWSDRGVPDQNARGVSLVLKLHGDAAHPRDIILAREQNTGEHFLSAAPAAVGALLGTSRPLWIGYGHSDPDNLLLDMARALGVSGGFAVVSSPKPILRSRASLSNR